MLIGNIWLSSECFSAVWTVFVVIFLTTMICSRRIADKMIKGAFKNQQTLNGKPIEYWVNKLKVPNELSLDIVNDNVITYDNCEYFIVDSTWSVITFGRMGISASMSQSKCWCLVAIDDKAIEKLEKRPFLFHRVTERNNGVCAYAIRRLYVFGCIVKNAGASKKS